MAAAHEDGSAQPDATQSHQAESDAQARPQSGLAAVLTAEPDEGPLGPQLIKQMGGLEGMIVSTLPILVLIPVNATWGLVPALVASLIAAVLSGVYLVIRGRGLQPAFSGVFGALIAALIAWLVGSAIGYFLYGIALSGIFAVVLWFSIILRRPLVGILYDFLGGVAAEHKATWRVNSTARWAVVLATVAWAVLFTVRFLVQGQLYLDDSVNLLGAARILMGWPLTIVAGLITWWAILRVRAATEDTTTPAAAEAPLADTESDDTVTETPR